MTEEESRKRLKIISIILAICLIISIGYIVIDKYTQIQQIQQINAYQLGFQNGYANAIIQIIQQAATCQQVPLIFENKTLNIIAVDCLK